MKFGQKLTSWIKNHKIAVSLGLFLILLGAIYLPTKVKAYVLGPEAEYQTANPQKKDLAQVVDVSGQVQAKNQAILKFQTSGKLAWVGVKKGDRVKKWQAIASLDKNELRKRLDKYLNSYLSERWDFEQDRDDYSAEGISLEEALISDAVKRTLEKDQFDLNEAVLDVEINQIAYDLATIYSPIEGIVTQIDIPVTGVNITPAGATFTIADPEIMIFEAKIDEADIAKTKEGQKVLIALDAYPDEEFEGKILRIDFTSTVTRGGGTAFPAEISLPENTELRFKNGLNGDAEIIIEEKEAILTIPLEALEEKNGQSFVQIIEGKKIKRIEVKVGLITDTRAEIISGLDENQKVITGEKKKNLK